VGKDYVTPLFERAYRKAVELLLAHSGEWDDVLDAYFLLRRFEDEIGFPFTYNMVEEMVERLRLQARQARKAAAEAAAV